MEDLKLKPVLVKTSTARRLLDCGESKFSQLVRAGKIRMVDPGFGYRMVDYRSIEALRDQVAKTGEAA
jgi:hypothetical protein